MSGETERRWSIAILPLGEVGRLRWRFQVTMRMRGQIEPELYRGHQARMMIFEFHRS